MTERGAPMTSSGFRKFIARLGEAAKYYLGRTNIMHTVRYTELSPERFKNFWED
jgi:hypothetical protein